MALKESDLLAEGDARPLLSGCGCDNLCVWWFLLAREKGQGVKQGEEGSGRAEGANSRKGMISSSAQRLLMEETYSALWMCGFHKRQ
eukprot:1191346-Prorocentrum_minimum.AAC.2